MKNKRIIILKIIILSLLSANALSQTYTYDSLEVRTILDSNELFDITVEEVTDSSEGCTCFNRVRFLVVKIFIK